MFLPKFISVVIHSLMLFILHLTWAGNSAGQLMDKYCEQMHNSWWEMLLVNLILEFHEALNCKLNGICFGENLMDETVIICHSLQ